MSAEKLRLAADLMRERSESARGSLPDTVPKWHSIWALMGEGKTSGDARHIASWHPAVALAVADWLDWIAQCREVMDGIAANVRRLGREPQGPGKASQMFLDMETRALAVARAYLNEVPS